jgi:hypothetical protein
LYICEKRTHGVLRAQRGTSGARRSDHLDHPTIDHPQNVSWSAVSDPVCRKAIILKRKKFLGS